jgi:hypothetical protein
MAKKGLPRWPPRNGAKRKSTKKSTAKRKSTKKSTAKGKR